MTTIIIGGGECSLRRFFGVGLKYMGWAAYVESLNVYLIYRRYNHPLLIIAPDLQRHVTISADGLSFPGPQEAVQYLLGEYGSLKIFSYARRLRRKSKYQVIPYKEQHDSCDTYRFYSLPKNLSALCECVKLESTLCVDTMDKIYNHYIAIRCNLGRDIARSMFSLIVQLGLEELAEQPLSDRTILAVQI